MTEKPAPWAQWDQWLEQLRRAGESVFGMLPPREDALSCREVDRLLAMTLAQGYWLQFHGDADNPEWVPFLGFLLPSGAINPDTLYYASRIDPAGVYRLSGHRGTVRMLDFQFNQRLPGSENLSGARTGSINADELAIGADGYFDVVVSRDRPEGHGGDWRPLPPATGSVLMRQVSYDWACEVDARVAIERLDRPVARPRPAEGDIARRLDGLAPFIVNFQRQFLGYKAQVHALGPANVLHLRTRTEKGGEGQGGGMGGQVIYHGNFDLARDEGLLIDTEIPGECHYWNIQVTDELHLAIDPLFHQTSLNGFQARLDSDGRFRAVISERDPGIPNWLDTAGRSRGGIIGRWTRANAAPVPATKVVKLSELRRFLPADTPVMSPERRECLVRARNRSAQMRRR